MAHVERPTRVLPADGRPAGAVPVSSAPSSQRPGLLSSRPPGSGPLNTTLASVAPPVSARLGGVYEALLELASGGMATVSIGRRVGAAGFERLVVIKRIHRHMLGREEMHKLFKDEARIASMIHHVNVASVIDVVEGDGELLLVMEYIESVSLSLLAHRTREARERMPVPVVVRILMDALTGLQAAHDAVDTRGRPLMVVHRDVSPQNIIVGKDGVSRVIDFGVAKAAHRLTDTESGHVKGKFGYMAPEQVMGKGVDRRTDVFAAGVVAFEALANSRLFAAENAIETMRRVMSEPIPDPAGFPDFPVPLRAPVMKALAREPDDRYPDAAAFASALARACPPASHGDVAEWVERRCGGMLAERRALLNEARSAETEVPLSATSPATPNVLEPPVSIDDSGMSEPTTHADVSVEQSIVESHPPGRWRAGWLFGLGVFIAAAGGTWYFAAHSANAIALPPASTSTVAFALEAPVGAHGGAGATGAPVGDRSATAATSQTQGSQTLGRGANAAPVVVTFHADVAIQGVKAPGIKDLELDGHDARVTLEPWSGDLPVEAHLEGKRDVQLRVSANGSHDITLAPGARQRNRRGPAGPAAPAAPTPKNELQASPYEQ